MAIADHHRVVADKENPVRSATRTPFSVAAHRICHLYGSLGSKKMPTPSNAPSTAPMSMTVGKLMIPASAALPKQLTRYAKSYDLTRIRRAFIIKGEHFRLTSLGIQFIARCG